MTILDFVALVCAVLILVSYAGVSTGRYPVRTLNAANAVFGIPVSVAAYVHEAWASLLIAGTWTVIGMVGLVRDHS